MGAENAMQRQVAGTAEGILLDQRERDEVIRPVETGPPVGSLCELQGFQVLSFGRRIEVGQSILRMEYENTFSVY